MINMRGRTPIIALDYSEKHKAVEKELLIDYETGNIYVVSKDDREVIFDITKEIRDKIQNITGDSIIINIEGIGEVNLSSLMKEVLEKVNNTVQVEDDKDGIAYIGKDFEFDSKSLEVKFNKAQIYGFDYAEDLTVLQKVNGTLKWSKISSDGEGGGSGGTENPDDGKESNKVYNIEPVNGKIYLNASKRQITENLSTNCKIILPSVLDEYCEIQWMLKTNSFNPSFLFNNNIHFRSSRSYQPQANVYNLYEFKSWDNGTNWICELTIFGISGSDGSQEVVTKQYLEENYVNKIELYRDYVDADKLFELYMDRNTITENYLDKFEIRDEYITRSEASKILSWNPEKPV